MTLLSDEDARDLEFQREIEDARQEFLIAAGEERSIAKRRYLELLRAFSERVLDRPQPDLLQTASVGAAQLMSMA